MKHYGDITKIKGSEVPITDIVCGGSPCQDLSVAGKRAGLAGERSGLYMEQIRIIKEMRNECVRQLSMSGADVDVRSISPRYMVWENVPGAFSSNKGEDFRAVLEEAAKVVDENAVIPGPTNGKWPYAGCIVSDGWSLAYSVHDAQYWGVPQRRRRICLLCDFNGDSAPKLLFELRRKAADTASIETIADFRDKPRSEVSAVSSGLCGNPEPSGEKGEDITGTSANGALKAVRDQGQCWDGSQIAPTLTQNNAGGSQRMPDKDNFNAVITPVCLEGNGSRPSHQGDGYKESDVMYTLNSTEQHAVTYGVDNYNQAISEEVTQPIRSKNADSDHIPCCIAIDRASFNQGKNAQYDFSVQEELAQTLVSKGPGGVMTEQ